MLDYNLGLVDDDIDGDGPAPEAVKSVLKGNVVRKAVFNTDINGKVMDILSMNRCIHQGINYKDEEAQGPHLHAQWNATGEGLEGRDSPLEVYSLTTH